MARVNFFANTNIHLRDIDFPTSWYPAPQDELRKIFDVPSHNIGTPNLLVFLDGVLQKLGEDYKDINSTQIEFMKEVKYNNEIYVILLVQIKPGEQGGAIGTNGWENEGGMQAIRFYKVLRKDVPATVVYDGQVYFTTDTNEMFMALPDGRVVAVGGSGGGGGTTVTLVGNYGFAVGDPIGWDETAEEYKIVENGLEPFGVVVAVNGNIYTVATSGMTDITVAGLKEGQEVCVNEHGQLAAIGEKIGKIVNGKVFVQIGGGKASSTTRDYYFMLGDVLNKGAQNKCEMFIPYKGKITEVVVSVGRDSEITSNFIFSVQYYHNSWQTLRQFELAVGKLSDKFIVNIPINNLQARINLISGNFQKLTNAMVMLKIDTRG